MLASLVGALRPRPRTPAFAWMVRLGAPLILRTDPEPALYGRYCIPARLTTEGFAFAFPSLPEALADLYARR